ncbi:MAG: 6,7-dimethyl-8-ribityllumazine synthase [Rhodospirillaceae bacterium]|nr:6,7-dimethyl-8-ribityllumazine synthase [Rhodospirillaceae bacterium]
MAPRQHKIMIVESRYYEDIAEELLRGAAKALDEAGAAYECVTVPGAFEIPAMVKFAIDGENSFDGFVTLGCVIRGETTHYDYVCQESARALQDLAVHHSLAIGYGILTCENRDQAWARASVDGGDKGGFVANACLSMIGIRAKFGQ